MSPTETEIRAIFARAGLRCTKQRVELYRALASTKSHPTAEQLRDMLGCGCCCSSLATVYNTLECFSKAGIVRRIPTANGPTRYDADTTQHLHVKGHDGSIIDVPDELGAKLIEQFPHAVVRQIEKALGIPIDHVSLELIAGNPRDN